MSERIVGSEYDGLTQDEAALAKVMSDISEECYCASWMQDCEFDIWRIATEGGSFGMLDADSLPTLRIARAWAERIGRWIVFNDDRAAEGHYLAVPLDEWAKRYADEMTARQERRAARDRH